jgi:hypothetical protein
MSKKLNIFFKYDKKFKKTFFRTVFIHGIKSLCLYIVLCKKEKNGERF